LPVASMIDAQDNLQSLTGTAPSGGPHGHRVLLLTLLRSQNGYTHTL